MKTLSERNEALLLLGAKTTGSMTEGYHYVEEELYIDEAKELFAFCQWVDKKIGGAGRANIKGLWLAFKYPRNKVFAAYADNVKLQIKMLNEL